MRRLWSIGLCVLCCGMLAACGASLDNPGVDGNKTLNNLNNDEQKQLTEILTQEVFNKEFIQTSCQISAQLSGTSNGQEACEKAKAECTQNTSLGASAYGAQVMGQFTKCDATVQQWANCMKATKLYLEQLNAALADKSCGTPITQQELLEKVDLAAFSQQCNSFYQKCSLSGGLPGTNPFPSSQPDPPKQP